MCVVFGLKEAVLMNSFHESPMPSEPFPFAIKGTENASTPLNSLVLAFTDADRWSSRLRWHPTTSYSVHRAQLCHRRLILLFKGDNCKHPRRQAVPPHLWLWAVVTGWSVQQKGACDKCLCELWMSEDEGQPAPTATRTTGLGICSVL